MNKLIVILLITFSSLSTAGDFKVDGTGSSNISGFTFSDGSKFSLYTSNGHWKSSSGDYGLSNCY